MKYPLKPAALCALAASLFGGPVAGLPARPEVAWSLQRHGLEFFNWRPRLVVGPQGQAWIGGAVPPGSPGGLLYRKAADGWEALRTPPEQAARTFVLDVDPAGVLWLCEYSPREETTYGGLRIRRYDGRAWREETVRPGIWPQVMDMVSPDEGWIGGNHGSLLHLAGGRWRLEPLPIPEEKRRELNIMALRMSGPGEGWLVGLQGLVARYHAGTWRVIPVPEDLRRVSFNALDTTPEGHLWVTGGQGLIARYDGRRWTRFAVPRPFDLKGLDMVSAHDGWAVGDRGTLLRWDGERWREQVSPTSADLYDVAMSSAGEGWVVSNREILRGSALHRPLLRDVAQDGRFPMARQPGRWVAAADVDGDGDSDLFSMQTAWMHLYENRGEEGFLEVPGLSSPPPTGLQGFAWGDLEGDGDLDLVVLGRNPGSVWLYRNLGGLRLAPPEHLRPARPGGQDSVALVDLDEDGDLDLYLARAASFKRLANVVFHNDGLGRFQPVDASTGLLGSEILTLWGDLDGDLDLDAILPGSGGREVRWLRNEGGRLRDATAGSGLNASQSEGQISQGGLLDLDLDGDLDVLLLGDRLSVFLNDGAGRFRRDDDLFGTVENNPAWSSTLSGAGDLDHDGYPEILLQTVAGDRRVTWLFSRGPDGRWRDVAARAGLADVEGSAAAFADWNGDGDLDLYVAGEEGGRLFENLQNDSNFLVLRLHGDRGNRQALGARVRIYRAGHLGEAASLRGHQQLGAGFGPPGVVGQGSLHFGLDARRLHDVEVVFPGGRRVVLRDVRPGRSLDVRESPPVLRQVVLAGNWAHRSWLAADPRREAAKLGLAVLALAVWPAAAGRPGVRKPARRWGLTVLLLAAYLLTAGCLAADGRPALHGLHLLGFAGTLGLLTVADRRIAVWRRSRFLGPYRLQEALGEGGMGVVHRARHRPTGRTVALKVLHPRMTEQEENRLRFLRESRILAGLEHPNIVRVFEIGEIDGRAYISMELLAGESLRSLARRRGPLRPAAVRAVLTAVCGALAHVHGRGIVHRDIKSDNIFLLDPESLSAGGPDWGQRVRLMDFGLARTTSMNTLTGRLALVGTLAYLPPEQLRGQAPDARSDLYSLGVVAWEALTGRLPFEAGDEGGLLALVHTGGLPPLRRLRPQVPADLAAVVERMLSRDPRDRPASAEEIAAALAGAPATEPSYGPGEVAVWQERFEEARRRLAEGRTTEAQVLALESLAELKTFLFSLDAGQQEEYCRSQEVAALVEMVERL